MQLFPYMYIPSFLLTYPHHLFLKPACISILRRDGIAILSSIRTFSFFGSAAMSFHCMPTSTNPSERKVRFTRTGKYVHLHPSGLRVTYKYMYKCMCECDYVFILRSSMIWIIWSNCALKYWSRFTLPFALMKEVFYVSTTHYGEPATSLKFNCCLCCLSTRELETKHHRDWMDIQKRVLCWYDHCIGFGHPVQLVTCVISLCWFPSIFTASLPLFYFNFFCEPNLPSFIHHLASLVTPPFSRHGYVPATNRGTRTQCYYV